MSAPSSVGQRFSQLIQALGMSKNAFAISLDKTATVIQHLVDERNKPGFDLMNKVVDVYPNVSIGWLLRGEGPMLLDGASTPAAAEPAATTPVTPAVLAAPKAVSATPNFPTPLFAVSTARPAAPEAAAPPAQILAAAPATPVAAGAQVAPAAVPASQPAPEPAVAAALPEALLASPAPLPVPTVAPAPTSPVALAPAALDAATLTAALHAQHLQHQLALAEQRNQHLLEQQKLILERQTLMQQMLDLMRRPI